MKRFIWVCLLLLPLLVSGCHHSRRGPDIKGSGNRVTVKREVPAFTGIVTEGAFVIEVTCQKETSLEIEGDDNIINLVKADVANNILRLTSSDNYSVSDAVKIKISVPNLESLAVTGAGEIDIKGMNNEKFEIDSDGAPKIYVAGNTKVLDIDSNGAGQIDTHNLRALRGVVESNGVSKIELDVKDELDVTVSGPSSVRYQGDPKVNKTINGPGSVERRGGEGA